MCANIRANTHVRTRVHTQTLTHAKQASYLRNARRLREALEQLSYFTTHQWIFRTQRLAQVC